MKFTDLIIWKESHNVVLEIYKMTEKYPNKETYGLVSQMRRAAVSIPANIAEGSKKQTKKDFLYFLNIAESSLEEVKYYMILSKDLGYINKDIFQHIYNKLEKLGGFITNFKKSIRKKMSDKGNKGDKGSKGSKGNSTFITLITLITFITLTSSFLIAQPAPGPGATGTFTNLQRRLLLRGGSVFASTTNDALTNSFIPVGDGTYYCKVNLTKNGVYNFIFQLYVNGKWVYEQLPAGGTFPVSIISNSVTSNTGGSIMKIDNDIRRKVTVPNYGSGTNFYLFCNFGHHPNPPMLSLLPDDNKVTVKIKSEGRWDGSPEPDVIYGGYFALYRSSQAGGPYALITNLQPQIPETVYTDTAVTNGHTYYYVAISYDTYQGTNRGPFDKEVSVPDFDTFIDQLYIDANMSSGYSLEKYGIPNVRVKIIFKVQNIDWPTVVEREKLVWLVPWDKDARFYYNKIPARIERIILK